VSDYKRSSDFVIELDRKVRQYLLTPQSDRAKDWLIENTNNLAQYWGKSLMVRRWEIDNLLGALVDADLSVYHSK
jgi:hypothetical protein